MICMTAKNKSPNSARVTRGPNEWRCSTYELKKSLPPYRVRLPARCMIRKQQNPRPVTAIISFFPTEVPRGFVGRFISSSNRLNLLTIYDEFMEKIHQIKQKTYSFLVGLSTKFSSHHASHSVCIILSARVRPVLVCRRFNAKGSHFLGGS